MSIELNLIKFYFLKNYSNGDSGGPLMIQRSKDLQSYHLQVGIVSFGPHQCASQDSPGDFD
jgi:secreted trypsin-like serine protease